MIEFKQITTTWTENDHTTIVALIDGNPVATCMVDYHGEGKKEALLWNLWVDPERRELRIASELIDHAIKDAKARGHKSITLEWSAKDTPGWVLDRYKRIGFKIESTYNSVRLKKKIK